MKDTSVTVMPAAGSRDQAQPGAGPRWLRFGLGLLVLGGDTLKSVLAASAEPGDSTGVDEPAAAAAKPSPRHTAWGMLVDLLDRGRRAPTLVRASLWRATTVTQRLAPSITRARRLARHLPGATRSAARWHAWNARRRAQLAGWAAVGQREEAASRAVARQALSALRGRALARVAESPDLKRVIREQSQGIAVTAVTELRNRSARADALAERTVRRLFGRGRDRRAGMSAAPSEAARPRAGFVSRLAAGIADAVILFVLLRGTVWLLNATALVLRRFAPPVDLATLVILSVPWMVALYYVGFWRWRGQTPGKWLLGIRVVALDDTRLGHGKIGIGRAVLRLVGYLISALPFYLGFLWILGPERRGFHDRLARTEVVYARRPVAARPDVGGRPRLLAEASNTT